MRTQITVAQMAPHIHSFLPGENKVKKLSAWLVDWIKTSLESGKIKPFDMLPLKGELACHIGVSLGTMQSVYRVAEDLGVIESKQKIGSYIKPDMSVSKNNKLTSKRELAVEVIKKYLLEHNYKQGDKLVSVRKLSYLTGISNTTLIAAINSLVSQKILVKKSNFFYLAVSNFLVERVETETLVEKIAKSLKVYITEEASNSNRLPSNSELALKFNVSVKTIYDAIKLLSKEGILYTRRGQYGTLIIQNVSKQEVQSYKYEKIEHKLRQYITENCKIGDKLPSIKEFAQVYNTSEKTIKRALDNLAEDGYLTFVRGRFGGTFVTDIPQNAKEAYKWLAINRED